MKSSKRNINLDLIRSIAVFLVLSVHFFLNNGYYNEIVAGKRMYIMTVMRTFFMTCVPLFLILSGYLCNGKQVEKKYYKGIINILLVYVLACFANILYKVLYVKQSYSIKDIIKSILDFSGAPYAWYINMYIGLFLMIPFLNLMYHGLDTQKKKMMLIATFLICCSLPSICNNRILIVPEWWILSYPIAYYFIGAYLKEYGLKLNVLRHIILLVLCVFAFGSLNFYVCQGKPFIWGKFNDWGSIVNVIDSVLLFSLLTKLKLDKLPGWLKRFIGMISKQSLAIYLVSSITDEFYYPILSSRVENMQLRLPYYFVIVPLSFFSALVIAVIINLISTLIQRFVHYFVKLQNSD